MLDSEEIVVGKRKRTSRLTTVDGQVVLKSNMYTVETGELSVWDRELGTHSEEAEPEVPRSIKRPYENKTIAPKVPVPRVLDESTVARHAYNEQVKQDQLKALRRRKHFMRTNWKMISPFVSGYTCPPVEEDIQNEDPFLPLTLQPQSIKNVQLRQYQLEGVNWLIQAYASGINVILGDEMGLGKTLQSITYLSWMRHVRGLAGPFLVLVPLSVLSNWKNEFTRFAPDLRVLKLHTGDKQERERLRKDVLQNLLQKYDVILTTYDMAKSDEMRQALIQNIYWRCVILDEGHIIRNENTVIANVARKLHFDQVVLLSGTPVQNNLHELWSLLNFLQPDVFSDAERFDACFDIRGDASKHRFDQKQLLKVHSMLEAFMLRRIKADVERSVPPKVEKKIMCPLTPMQTLWYKKFLLKDSSLLVQLELEEAAEKEKENSTQASTGAAAAVAAGGEQEGGGGGGVTEATQKSRWRRLQSLYMQLRKVCNHPFLFPEADPQPGYTSDSIVAASGKLQILDRLLWKLHQSGHRVVVFSQFTSVLDILEDYFNYRGYEYNRLDGSVNRVQRQVDINAFNAPNSPLFVFLMSTRAGGLGVNLQTADTVVLYDSDWNPMVDLQAMARVHRIGQKKVVHVYRLVSGGTVEERIVQRAEKKLYLDQVVNQDSLRGKSSSFSSSSSSSSSGGGGGGGGNDEVEGMNTTELLDMLRFGADVICQTASSDRRISDAELDAIISRDDEGGDNSSSKLQTTSNTSIGTSTSANTAAAAAVGVHTTVGSSFADADANTNSAAIKTHQQFSAREFDLTLAPTDTRLFQGAHYDKYNLAVASYAVTAGNSSTSSNVKGLTKRQVKNTLVNVKDDYGHVHQVLRKNMYDLNVGEGSAFAPGHGRMPAKKANTLQRAGRDFENEDNCLVCFTGGDLVCCDYCPASFHLQCIGLKSLPRNTWRCPHHRCVTCDRAAAAAGGLLFRCAVCPQAFCEDHMPSEAAVINRCYRMEATGYKHPRQACYIHCSHPCIAYATAADSTGTPQLLEPESVDAAGAVAEAGAGAGVDTNCVAKEAANAGVSASVDASGGGEDEPQPYFPEQEDDNDGCDESDYFVEEPIATTATPAAPAATAFVASGSVTTSTASNATSGSAATSSNASPPGCEVIELISDSESVVGTATSASTATNSRATSAATTGRATSTSVSLTKPSLKPPTGVATARKVAHQPSTTVVVDEDGVGGVPATPLLLVGHASMTTTTGTAGTDVEARTTSDSKRYPLSSSSSSSSSTSFPPGGKIDAETEAEAGKERQEEVAKPLQGNETQDTTKGATATATATTTVVADTATTASFISLVEAMDFAAPERLQLTFRRHKLPPNTGIIHCKLCFKQHHLGACECALANKGVSDFYTEVDESFSLEKGKVVFLSKLIKYSSTRKRQNAFPVSTSGFSHFTDYCMMYRFKELLAALLEDGTLVVEEILDDAHKKVSSYFVCIKGEHLVRVLDLVAAHDEEEENAERGAAAAAIAATASVKTLATREEWAQEVVQQAEDEVCSFIVKVFCFPLPHTTRPGVWVGMHYGQPHCVHAVTLKNHLEELLLLDVWEGHPYSWTPQTESYLRALPNFRHSRALIQRCMEKLVDRGVLVADDNTRPSSSSSSSSSSSLATAAPSATSSNTGNGYKISQETIIVFPKSSVTSPVDGWQSLVDAFKKDIEALLLSILPARRKYDSVSQYHKAKQLLRPSSLYGELKENLRSKLHQAIDAGRCPCINQFAKGHPQLDAAWKKHELLPPTLDYETKGRFVGFTEICLRGLVQRGLIKMVTYPSPSAFTHVYVSKIAASAEDGEEGFYEEEILQQLEKSVSM